jgi:hypothetical protein
MAPRADLQTLLEGILGSGNVYFQPPPGIQLQYPCIVYQRYISSVTEYADNAPYRFTQHYQVTVIDQDPDSAIPNKVAALPMCDRNRFFAANQLNHDVFFLYF